MGWRDLNGSEIHYSKENEWLSGYVTPGTDCLLKTATWLDVTLSKVDTVTVELINKTDAEKAELYIAPVDYSADGVWQDPSIDFKSLTPMTMILTPDSDMIQRFEFDLSQYKNTNLSAKALFLRPAVGATIGQWHLCNITVK